MAVRRGLFTVIILGLVLASGALANARTVDSLPSWNDGTAKKSIVEFVAKVTKAGSPDFVTPAERIALFDNDCTVWAGQPMYFQLLFAIDRVKLLAPHHLEWKDEEPFASPAPRLPPSFKLRRDRSARQASSGQAKRKASQGGTDLK